jgi:hypothetical protein
MSLSITANPSPEPRSRDALLEGGVGEATRADPQENRVGLAFYDDPFSGIRAPSDHAVEVA